MGTTAPVLALLIFTGMFWMIVWGRFPRQNITMISGSLVLVVVFGICKRDVGAIWRTLRLDAFFEKGFWFGGAEEVGGINAGGINWATIVFIGGMMIMVEGLGEAGFFRWLCFWTARLVRYRVMPLLLCFMVMSAVLAMFIDSITVVLFLAAVTLELAELLRFNPVPMIIAEIFCANLGGAATMSGDPPNIIIGTALGYSFGDFLANTGVVALLCFLVMLLYFPLLFYRKLKKSPSAKTCPVSCPPPAEAIHNRKLFFFSVTVFAAAVILLAAHGAVGVTVALIGVFMAILTVAGLWIFESRKSAAGILRKVDYQTLLFFIGLFVSVSGLEETGVLKWVAEEITLFSNGKVGMVVLVILMVSAVGSALVDNIPFAATMLPVIQSISASQGIDLSVLAWTLSLGTDFGGNATPIGGSANVVGVSIAEKQGHHIGWLTYCKYCVPATAIIVFIALAVLDVRYLS